MSVRTLRIAVIALLMAVGTPWRALATTTYVVGPSTCLPGKVHFSTIQSAVSSVAAGSNVYVCPGTYPEQVVITQPLTLSGVTDGTGDAAAIPVLWGGLFAKGTPPPLGRVGVNLRGKTPVRVRVRN